jgi:hypothetical protein
MRLIALALILATPAAADPLPVAEAQALMFPPDGSVVTITGDALPADQATLLQTATTGQPYHGAIAISPDEGLMAEATVAAVNHHSAAAATAQALADCNAKKTGAADCVVVAVIAPEGFQDRALTLSADATRALADLTGAMAISASTGKFGTGADGDAAVGACGVADCVVAVQD